MADPLAPAHRALESAVDAIARLWDALPPGRRPELDPAEDCRLEERITTAFQSGDLGAALAAVAAWKAAWLDLLGQHPLPPGISMGQAESQPAEKAEGVHGSPDLRGLHATALFERAHDPASPPAEREASRSEVHRRAWEMAEESTGQRPRRRPLGAEMCGPFQNLPGVTDEELLRRLADPRLPAEKWRVAANAANARDLIREAPVLVTEQPSSRFAVAHDVHVIPQRARPGAAAADEVVVQAEGPVRAGRHDSEGKEVRFTATSSSSSVPEGIHPATLSKVEERENTKGPYLVWSFQVDLGGQSRRLTGVTNTYFTPRARARMWTEAILGRELHADEVIDTDALVGQQCRVLIKHRMVAGKGEVPGIEDVLAIGPDLTPEEPGF